MDVVMPNPLSFTTAVSGQSSEGVITGNTVILLQHSVVISTLVILQDPVHSLNGRSLGIFQYCHCNGLLQRLVAALVLQQVLQH
jgi:hypothetical protein